MVTDELRELIVQRRSATEMLAVAMRNGIRPMCDDGWTKVLKGLTTVEEIVRVTKVNVAALA